VQAATFYPMSISVGIGRSNLEGLQLAMHLLL
jgi:hypothetical protein